jgi:catechol 2,3-dioxygenase-like lactoylglutathione lyase family enzyme
MCLLSDFFFARHAEAGLGPCTTAAPTTPNVIVFVSDIERSVRWYRDNVGLAEASEPDIAERHDSQVTVMARNRAGVALVSFGRTSRFSRDVQMVCFDRSWQRFDLRHHIRSARDPVRRVAALKDPDGAVRAGAFSISQGTKRFVTGETLNANLRRQHRLRSFACNQRCCCLLRPHQWAEKNSCGSQEY